MEERKPEREGVAPGQLKTIIQAARIGLQNSVCYQRCGWSRAGDAGHAELLLDSVARISLYLGEC